MIYNSNLLEFNSKNHVYKYDGVKVPSVTTILEIIAKPALPPWAASIAATRFANELTKFTASGEFITSDDIEMMRDVSAKSIHTDGKAGARLGTLVHESIEDHLLKKNSKTQSAAIGYVNAFQDWWKIEKRTHSLVAVEHRLFHPQWIYAGTCDMVLRHKTTGTIKIVDYKTTKRSKSCPYGIYAEYLVQAAAYAEAWNAASTSKRDSCVETTILNVSGDSTYHTITRDTFDISQDFQVFRQAQVLRDNLKELECAVKPEKRRKQGEENAE